MRASASANSRDDAATQNDQRRVTSLRNERPQQMPTALPRRNVVLDSRATCVEAAVSGTLDIVGFGAVVDVGASTVGRDPRPSSGEATGKGSILDPLSFLSSVCRAPLSARCVLDFISLPVLHATVISTVSGAALRRNVLRGSHWPRLFDDSFGRTAAGRTGPDSASVGSDPLAPFMGRANVARGGAGNGPKCRPSVALAPVAVRRMSIATP